MALELADIFRQFGPAYRQKYAAHLLPSHRRVMRDIERCRTAALGGQVYRCSACGEVQYSYHSCRNRHCPKCQSPERAKWLAAQHSLLLPVPRYALGGEGSRALCPRCGHDLNAGPGGCAPAVDLRWRPLAALKDKLPK